MAKSDRFSQFHVYCFHVNCFLHFDLKRCLKTIFPKQFKISNFSEREHWISKNTLRKYVTHLFTMPLSNVISDSVLRDYNAAFLSHCWFLFFYDVGVDNQIWALLTRNCFRVSDTQVTIKSSGPLVELLFDFSILVPLVCVI